MTWGLLIYGMYATTTCVLHPWMGYSAVSVSHMVLFNTMSVLAMYSHLAAMTTDPGSVPKESRPLPDDEQENDFEANEKGGNRDPWKKYCKRCKAFKPVRAHHCSICSRCIVKMDHHCPWVNNCVGIGNHKLFLLFLFWVNSVCIYSLVLLIAKFIMCRGECGSTNQHLLSVFLLVEAVLFGLFTLCMKGDQISVVTTNQTQIDKLKNHRHEVLVEYNEVFGCTSDTKFHPLWLIPIPAALPDGVRERLLGYRIEMKREEGGGGSGSGGGGPGGDRDPLLEDHHSEPHHPNRLPTASFSSEAGGGLDDFAHELEMSSSHAHNHAQKEGPGGNGGGDIAESRERRASREVQIGVADGGKDIGNIRKRTGPP